jgi:retron-type reverse transcriptase
MKKKIIYLNHLSTFQKDLSILRLYYKNCYTNPNLIFYKLGNYLNLNLIWYLAFKNVTQNNEFSYIFINELEERELMKLKQLALEGIYIWGGVHTKRKSLQSIQVDFFWKDLVIEEIIKIIIEPIFEINFEHNSFGFRPYRTCHTALSYITTGMQNTIWVLDGNLKGWFDLINIDQLLKILTLRIQDVLILNLIKSGLKTKVINGNYAMESDLGIPIGSRLSSLLSNIYLDFFDKWMNNLCFQSCDPKLQSIKNIFTNHLVNFISVHFLRFGDSFLIGINGPFYFAVEIQKKIINYLKNYLHINENFIKLDIKHLSKGVSFLGYFWKRKIAILKSRFKNSKQNYAFAVLEIEIKTILKVLQNQNICDGSGKALPLFAYLHLSQKESNVKVNNILLFFCNWCALAVNRRYIVAFIAGIFRLALSKMYAAKFKLRTTVAVLKKGGYFLNKSLGVNKKKDITIPKILYSKYNQIPDQTKSQIYLKDLFKYSYHLKQGKVLNIILRI